MSDLRHRFGRLVAANRHRKRMTQQQLAEAANLSPDMIARIEMGKTGARFPSIQRIADALGIDPGELFLPTDIKADKPVRGKLADVSSRLSGLSDRDLGWIDDLLDAALKPRV
jgi:transcriptional regulator with XRE-family HTH domain